MKSSPGTTQGRSRRGEVLRHFLLRALAARQALTILGGAMLITFLATLAGIFVDHRVITGAPAWLKPAKFAISVSVYCFTFVWLLGFVENHPRLVRVVANVTAFSVIAEMIAIIAQAARGTTSHFNLTTPLNSLLWIMMGAFIVLVWTMNLVVAIMLLLQRMPEASVRRQEGPDVVRAECRPAIERRSGTFEPTTSSALHAAGFLPHMILSRRQQRRAGFRFCRRRLSQRECNYGESYAQIQGCHGCCSPIIYCSSIGGTPPDERKTSCYGSE